MKREEKSNQIKSTIIGVSSRLFMVQGYQKTTIRQIVEEAGIKIGTLYHFFRGKEEIILHTAHRVDQEFTTLVEQIMGNRDDYILKYALYRALEFKMVETNDTVAELYLESYISWRLTQLVIPRNLKRNKLFFQEYSGNFTEEDYYRLTMAARGMRLAFIAERVHTGANRFEEYTPFIIDTALAFFNVPKKKREAAIAEAMNIARDRHWELLGVSL